MGKRELRILVDEELLKDFSYVCDDNLLTMPEAIEAFMKKTVEEYRIPFSCSPPVPNRETLEAIAESEEILKNPSKYPSYSSVEELIEALRREEEEES